MSGSWWNSCEYCPPFVELVEITPYERAYCPNCYMLHAWGGAEGEDERWFGLDEKHEIVKENGTLPPSGD
jgi:hypothetical protein